MDPARIDKFLATIGAELTIPEFGERRIGGAGGVKGRSAMIAVDEPGGTVPGSIVPTRVRLRVGQSDAIVFPGNASTGYSWDSTVEPPGSPCVVTSWCLLPDPLRRMGGPDLDILVITGVKPGAATVTAIYHRRWDPDRPPAETHKIAVTVERQE